MQILKTTPEDLKKVKWLFSEAMKLKNRAHYTVWKAIDQNTLIEDIEAGLQYKIVIQKEIVCIFSIQFEDRYIWDNRDQNDAIYLHRVVTHPDFKGQRLFQKVLDWTIQFAIKHQKSYIRLDTMAVNKSLQDYYLSYDFEYIKTQKTPNLPELPLQNRNQELALFELKIESI